MGSFPYLSWSIIELMECCICKCKQKNFIHRHIITLDLAKTWDLTPDQIKGFNHRESDYCHQCGSSLRSRSLAQAIMRCYPESKTKYFVNWVEWAKKKGLAIAEINYCGQLHPFLARNPGTITSQYREHTLRGRIANWLNGIRAEDITDLSYKSDSFDLVLHSEVLEHVDDTKKALKECQRILKPNGFCLFTVPLIPNRTTKRRARLERKTIRYYGKPSYHGSGEEDNLVFWEFGGDMIKMYALNIVLSDQKNFIWVLKIKK